MDAETMMNLWVDLLNVDVTLAQLVKESSHVVKLALLLTRHLWSSSSSSCSSCKVVMRERVRVSSRVVIRMFRREQDSIEAEAWSIDRNDERLKRDEMRHSDEWSRWVCMGFV